MVLRSNSRHLILYVVHMKFAALFLLAFLGQAPAPDSPATAPHPDYPLHVRILLTKASGNRNGFTGFGRGNLLDPTLKGIDFTYDCGEAFLNNGPAESYQAKWKKPDRQLEILMQRIGSDHLDRCQLNIAYKAEPYKTK
jgi:hypothetical protein